MKKGKEGKAHKEVHRGKRGKMFSFPNHEKKIKESKVGRVSNAVEKKGFPERGDGGMRSTLKGRKIY